MNIKCIESRRTYRRLVFGMLRILRAPQLVHKERLASGNDTNLFKSNNFTKDDTIDEEKALKGADVIREKLNNSDLLWCWKQNCNRCHGFQEAWERVTNNLTDISSFFSDHVNRIYILYYINHHNLLNSYLS